jgi:hypothetical protein
MGFIVLPLLVAGMVANNRRIVWVEIAAPLITYWLISRPSKIKRLFLRGLLVASPLVLLYIGAGWNSGADFFAPVRTVRSLGDGEVNASTLYRDLENYNLIATIREEPIIGTGFGHPFVEVVKLPDISFFREYLYMPHNSILGLYAFCGPIGFTGLTMVIVIGVYLAAIGYRRAQTSDERIASFMAIAGAIIFLEHCWGDIGFSERRTMLIFGPLLAIAGQVAVSTGAWRKSSSRVRPNAAMRA